MYQAKKPVWPWIVGTLTLIGVFGAGPAVKFVKDAKHTLKTENILVVQNNRLYHLTQNWGQEGKYEVIQEPADKGLKVAARSGQIEIDDHGTIYTKNVSIQESRYLSKGKRVYFSAVEPLSSTKSGRPIAGFRLWSWSKKDGFQPSTPVSTYVGQMSTSLDNSKLFVRVDDGSVKPRIFQIESLTNEVKEMNLPSFIFVPDAVVDEDTILYTKSVKKPNKDEPERQVWVYRRSSKRTERLLPTHNIERATIFDGHIWVLETFDERVNLLELNKDLSIHR